MSGWQIMLGKLQTRWAQEVDPQNPLPEYPRPQLVRPAWQNLNGLWDYAVRPREDEPVTGYDGEILVPFAIESALSGVMQPLQPEERLWYRRKFRMPADWQGQRVLLHFGAVDWQARVWCNGVELGEHEGGYDPFSFDISAALDWQGENELVLAVWDPTSAGRQERGKQTLKPGFVFYTAVSGIWQTVWLEAVPQTYIQSLWLTPDIDRGVLNVRLETNGVEETLQMTCTASGRDQAGVSASAPAWQGVNLRIADARLWTPEDPFLYDLEVRLEEDGAVLDRVQSYFGMRQISLEQAADGFLRLHLNHEPVFHYGPLDQGYWPDGLYTAPTDEALRYDIEFCKSLGMNMIRKHIKVEPARWYYHCDRLGMLVWQDMPNGGIVPHTLILGMGFLLNLKLRDDRGYQRFGREDDTVRKNYRRELKAMIDKLYNHPCVVVWVPFNESWGQFDARMIGDWVKAYDPSRLVDAASGWFDQGNGDIYSIHKYVGPAMPKTEKRRAVALSEFGGIGLKVAGHLWQEEKLFAYRMVKSEEALTDWYLRLMEKLTRLKEQGLAAAIYTETCDVEYEVNGFLTYDRAVMKMDADKLEAAHARLIGRGENRRGAEDAEKEI